MINYPPELAKKAKNAKSVEDLLEMAGEEDFELEREEAERIFDRLNAVGELSGDEIDAVTGGGCNSPSTPSFSGTWVSGYELSTSCPVCHNNCWSEAYFIGNGPRSYLCTVCSARSRYNLSSAPVVVPVTEEAGHPNTKSRSRVWVE